MSIGGSFAMWVKQDMLCFSGA